MIIKSLKIHKFLLVFLFLLIIEFLFFCYAQQTENSVQSSITYYGPNDYLYGKYIKDPSEAIYDAEQNREIYDNYGSSASMEYLNRGDADYYNGGSDFDRNY